MQMARHRYKVGQSVEFSPGRLAPPASSREYKILRLLPFEHGDLLYRIKSTAETCERVAKESELSQPKYN
jgi:hypothetical protein